MAMTCDRSGAEVARPAARGADRALRRVRVVVLAVSVVVILLGPGALAWIVLLRQAA